jgi:hypothetical protein
VVECTELTRGNACSTIAAAAAELLHCFMLTHSMLLWLHHAVVAAVSLHAVHSAPAALWHAACLAVNLTLHLSL